MFYLNDSSVEERMQAILTCPRDVPVYLSRSKPAAPVQFEPNWLCGYEKGENMENMLEKMDTFLTAI